MSCTHRMLSLAAGLSSPNIRGLSSGFEFLPRRLWWCGLLTRTLCIAWNALTNWWIQNTVRVEAHKRRTMMIQASKVTGHLRHNEICVNLENFENVWWCIYIYIYSCRTYTFSVYWFLPPFQEVLSYFGFLRRDGFLKVFDFLESFSSSAHKFLPSREPVYVEPL